MVRIVHQAERLPYPAADILRVFPPLEREQGKADNGAGEAIDLPHQPPEPLSHARLAVLKESHGHLFDLNRYGGHHSQRDLALAGVAARLGWPIADAWALIIRLREGLDGKEGHKLIAVTISPRRWRSPIGTSSPRMTSKAPSE